MRGLGQGVKEFKKGVNDVKEEAQENETDKATSENGAESNQEPLNSDTKQASENDKKQ